MKTNVSLEDYKKIISATKTLSTPLLKIAYIVIEHELEKREKEDESDN